MSNVDAITRQFKVTEDERRRRQAKVEANKLYGFAGAVIEPREPYEPVEPCPLYPPDEDLEDVLYTMLRHAKMSYSMTRFNDLILKTRWRSSITGLLHSAESSTPPEEPPTAAIPRPAVARDFGITDRPRKQRTRTYHRYKK